MTGLGCLCGPPAPSPPRGQTGPPRDRQTDTHSLGPADLTPASSTSPRGQHMSKDPLGSPVISQWHLPPTAVITPQSLSSVSPPVFVSEPLSLSLRLSSLSVPNPGEDPGVLSSPCPPVLKPPASCCHGEGRRPRIPGLRGPKQAEGNGTSGGLMTDA
ncbi:hypothetical protein J1605_005936 [Eschrichtius robustus]|uniref:Uncharacterized protein n=1 Tax=Eschrichtius robustus TaxID=9764 RepID=A0AB34H816_ESCRO|nr:hypothetical protein J1605_005936 [Eschrichtius robustus]